MSKLKLKDNLLSFIFLGFIFIMMVLYFALPKSEYSSLEKRYLSDFPKFDVDDLLSGDYTADIESYLADQTPMRSLFVGINSYANLLLGNNGSNGVYLGKNDMLIEKPVSRDNILERNIDNINYFAENIDIPFSAVVVPSKGYIYGDNLPSNSLKYLDDEYFDYISDNLSEKIDFIDIRENFKAVASNYKLYYNTDHHWTSFGAFTAYENICKSLGIAPKNKDDYNVEVYSDFYGTSYSTSAYYLTKSEDIEVWRSKETGGKTDVTIAEGSEITEHDSLFFDENLNGDDKYTVYLDGNHSYVEVHNDSADNDKTLLVIKDSFAHCLVPFLSDHYESIVMIDLRYYKLSLDELIKEKQIDEALLVYGIDNICTSTDMIFSLYQ